MAVSWFALALLLILGVGIIGLIVVVAIVLATTRRK